MSLIDQAKADILQITTNSDEWGVNMVITTPDGLTTANIIGLHTKHHMGFDTDGNSVNAKNSHVSFSESQLTDLGYPVRNANQEVDLLNHRIDVNDSTDITKSYVINQNYPDETIGLIVCILSDFE